MRGLFWFSSRLNLNVAFAFILGKVNSHADPLSRLQVDSFHQSARSSPSTISLEAWSLFPAP